MSEEFKKYLESKEEIVDRELKRFLPKELSKGWLEKSIGTLRYGYNNESFANLTEPIWDLLNRGGKRWRPIFMLLCYESLGGKSNIDEFIPIIEIIHNGTLM